MLVDIKLRCMQNSGHGEPHMTPFMTIFRFYVSAHIPNIEKNQLYDVYKSGRYLIQILIKFPFECQRNHVWKPIFDPVMTIFINVNILDNCRSLARSLARSLDR